MPLFELDNKHFTSNGQNNSNKYDFRDQSDNTQMGNNEIGGVDVHDNTDVSVGKC